MTDEPSTTNREKLSESLFEGLGSFVEVMTDQLVDGLRKASDEVKRDFRAEERERRSNVDTLQEASVAIQFAYEGECR